MGKFNNFMNNNQGLVGSVGSAIDSFQTMGENSGYNRYQNRTKS